MTDTTNIQQELEPMDRLLEVIATLRGKDGCPWDREQTLSSLKPYLIEEAYELLEVMDGPDAAKHCEELGDVLLQILLHSRLREETGAFTFDDVARQLTEKLIRRHPHVFGDTSANESDAVVTQWERIKAEERIVQGAPGSALDGIPSRMPALLKAHRMQSRAARVGFDWESPHDVLKKIEEELDEVKEALACGEVAALMDEIGDLLFSVVNLSRFLKLNAELAMQQANRKFERRFRAVECLMREQKRNMHDCRLAELDMAWDTVKQQEREGGGYDT